MADTISKVPGNAHFHQEVRLDCPLHFFILLSCLSLRWLGMVHDNGCRWHTLNIDEDDIVTSSQSQHKYIYTQRP
jgi:hypothetical protein